MRLAVAGKLERIRRRAARVWLGIREWCGDRAYERYQEAQARRGGGAAQLSRQDFYVAQLEKRYSRVSRCC